MVCTIPGVSDGGDQPKELTRHERTVYGRAGLDENEAMRWRDHGVTPYWAEQFVAMGLDFEQAAAAAGAGFGPAATQQLRARGLAFEEFGRWAFAKGEPAIVVWAIDNGIDPTTAEQLAKRVPLGIFKPDKGLPELSAELDRIGGLLRGGAVVDELDLAALLAILEKDRQEARRSGIHGPWRNAVAEGSRRGLTPLEVLCGESEHDPAFVAPRLIADRSAPYLRREDGGPLSPALRHFEDRRPPVAELRRIGFVVVERDSRQEFIGELLAAEP